MLLRQVRYRTSDAEKYLQTCNSGVSATFLSGDANILFYGIIRFILEVTYAGKQHVLLDVNWFRRSLENQSVRGTSWVHNLGANIFEPVEESIVSAHHIDCQVFFVPDPEKDGYLHVFSYSGSSSMPPEHHFGADGVLIDL
jgi:hypothetical protein